LAERLGTQWRIIERVCSEEVALRRIKQGKKHPAKNRTAELYFEIREQFEEITHPRLVVDTSGAMPVEDVGEYLKTRLAADER
jgi:hypothetical protein